MLSYFFQSSLHSKKQSCSFKTNVERPNGSCLLSVTTVIGCPNKERETADQMSLFDEPLLSAHSKTNTLNSPYREKLLMRVSI